MHAFSDILTPGRTRCRLAGVSKKRLFETIARVVADDQPDIPYDDLLDKLVGREKLGSTGLGQGIAIPHCRVSHCKAPLGSLLSLARPIAFDAPDDEPVDLLFVLLVPEEANQQHLDILAEIARLFSQPDYCSALRAADSDRALFEAALTAAG
jgi:PTS system nitrogen regulatory IIA component